MSDFYSGNFRIVALLCDTRHKRIRIEGLRLINEVTGLVTDLPKDTFFDYLFDKKRGFNLSHGSYHATRKDRNFSYIKLHDGAFYDLPYVDVANNRLIKNNVFMARAYITNIKNEVFGLVVIDYKGETRLFKHKEVYDFVNKGLFFNLRFVKDFKNENIIATRRGIMPSMELDLSKGVSVAGVWQMD